MEELKDYKQEYTETPSQVPNIFAPFVEQMADQLAIEALPDEILDIHIFCYFNFNYWMLFIMPVCKKWKRICVRSNQPKQLTIRKLYWDPITLLVISKYQPTTIQFDYKVTEPKERLSIYSLLQLVRASKRCTTLVLTYPILKQGNEPLDQQKLTQITTLCICDEDLHCLKFFPNVQYLQICVFRHAPYISRKMVPNIICLVIIKRKKPFTRCIKGSFSYVMQTLHNLPADLDPIDADTTFDSDLKQLSYEEFFLWGWETKLAKLVSLKRYDEARKLLQTQETTLQREIELANDRRMVRSQKPDILRHHDFKFGFYPCSSLSAGASVIDVHNLYEKEIAQDLYEQLGTCCIEVKPEVKLNLIARFGSTSEAITAIKSLTNEMLTTKAIIALHNLIVREDVRQELINDPILRSFVITVQGFRGRKLLEHWKSVEMFDKLSDFIDWQKSCPKKYIPGKTSEQVYGKALEIAIANGAAANYKEVGFLCSLNQFLKASSDWSILDKLKEVNKSVLDLLLKSIYDIKIRQSMSRDVYFKIIQRYNYDVNEIAVSFAKHFPNLLEEFTTLFKIDWAIAVEKANKSPYLSHLLSETVLLNLLKNGVDPRFVPKNSMNVISSFIHNQHNDQNMPKTITIIDTLLEFGVDINEPSVNYMQQKHTPLTMAILTRKSAQLIEFLKSRGALTDEEVMMNSN